MGKHKKYLSVSEFCEMNGIPRYKFYKILHHHPELARRIRTSTSGERQLDELSLKTAKAIFRKEKIEDKRKLSANAAAGEINILAVQVDELREQLKNLQSENEQLKKFLGREKKDGRKNKAIASAVLKKLGRDYLPGDEKRLAEYLSSCNDFKIFMDSRIEKAEECDFKNEDR